MTPVGLYFSSTLLVAGASVGIRTPEGMGTLGKGTEGLRGITKSLTF